MVKNTKEESLAKLTPAAVNGTLIVPVGRSRVSGLELRDYGLEFRVMAAVNGSLIVPVGRCVYI